MFPRFSSGLILRFLNRLSSVSKPNPLVTGKIIITLQKKSPSFDELLIIRVNPRKFDLIEKVLKIKSKGNIEKRNFHNVFPNGAFI